MNLISKLERLKENFYDDVQIFDRPNGDICICLGHKATGDEDVVIILPLGEQHILFWDVPADQGLLEIINEGG